jgi:hypothetical protein
MKRSELIKNIKTDLDDKYSENAILSIIHLAESYGMAPPEIIRPLTEKEMIDFEIPEGGVICERRWENE